MNPLDKTQRAESEVRDVAASVRAELTQLGASLDEIARLVQRRISGLGTPTSLDTIKAVLHAIDAARETETPTLIEAFVAGHDHGYENGCEDAYPAKWLLRVEFDAFLTRWERENDSALPPHSEDR